MPRLAFLKSSQGGTLADLRQFLRDEKFRREFLPTVRDAEVLVFWQEIFPRLIVASRAKYGTPRALVEADLLARLTRDNAPPPPSDETGGTPAAKPKPPPAPPTPVAVKPPKPAEIPKAVGLLAIVEPELAPPEDTNAGDLQHNDLKRQIGTEAETFDYTVAYEKDYPAVHGRADIVLVRGGQTIIGQVSVTNHAKYEAESIRKFLQAGVNRIALVAVNRQKLNLVRQSLVASGDLTDAIGFYTPSEFIQALCQWATADPEGGTTERGKLRKQTIDLTVGPLSEVERKANEKRWLANIAGRMAR